MTIFGQLSRIAFVGAVALGAASSVSAQTSYNYAGLFGQSPFSYGKLNPDGAVTPFAQTCGTYVLNGEPIYCGAAANELVTKYDANTLALHPGNADLDNTAVVFTAQFTGQYSFAGMLSNLTDGGNGDGVSYYLTSTGVQTYLGATSGSTADSYLVTLSDFTLQAGQSFILMFDSHGDNQFDGIGLQAEINGTAAQAAADVPEPASWALMIGGFGMIGGALRRRRASVSFA